MDVALAPSQEAEPPADPRTETRGHGAADSESPPVRAHWLGRVPYRETWALQKRLAARRAEGEIGDRLLLVEHPAVLTLGRHADASHVRATASELERRGIEVVRVERGGEVTYHGPGQLVAYPIVALHERELLLRPFVRALEAAMSATCARLGVEAGRRDGHPGCWCDPAEPDARKIGALGLRIERGVTFHGIALNVEPDLADFELIDPCGMPGVISTSIARELGHSSGGSLPPLEEVAMSFAGLFAAAIAAPLTLGLD